MENEKFYFYGTEVSSEGVKHGKVDYYAFSQAFNHILCNNVVELMNDFNYGFELENGQEYYLDEDDNEIWYDIYQYFIVSDNGASIIKRYTDEILWYSEKLDMYIWGVTHYGTSWTGVLTDIPL